MSERILSHVQIGGPMKIGVPVYLVEEHPQLDFSTVELTVGETKVGEVCGENSVRVFDSVSDELFDYLKRRAAWIHWKRECGLSEPSLSTKREL